MSETPSHDEGAQHDAGKERQQSPKIATHGGSIYICWRGDMHITIVAENPEEVGKQLRTHKPRIKQPG